MKNILITTAMVTSMLAFPVFAGDRDHDDDDDYKVIQGPQGDTGATGPQGVAGKDGVVDYGKMVETDAVVATVGSLELFDPTENTWTWSVGIGGVDAAGTSREAVAAGFAYGINDDLMAYGKVGHSLSGSATSYFVGVGGKF